VRGLERNLGALCRAAAVYMAKNKLKSVLDWTTILLPETAGH